MVCCSPLRKEKRHVARLKPPPRKGGTSYKDVKEGAESATTRLRARARLARRDLKDLKATLSDQATDLKEEARLKILAQLDKLEKALSKDPDETEDQWNEQDA